MTRSKVHLGAKLTVKTRVEAYYSGRNGYLEVWLEPGQVATVGAVNVPYVRNRAGHGNYFVCLDFVRYGREWRAAVDYANLAEAGVSE